MAVFRVEKTKDFTIMCNHHLRNRKLSLKAKGLLSLMLSLPEDWDYWESNVEMTARAFACYVKDRLPYQSDYLVGHAESCVTIAFDKSGHSEVIRAYPQGEERKAINAAFDEIVADLKLERIFTHTAEITALEASAIPLKDVAQLSLFGSDKPSVIGQLASAKAAEKAVPTPKKTHEPER